MRLIVISITFFLLSSSVLSQSGSWSVQTIDTGSLFDVSFVDSLYGWSVGHNGKVYATTNGGTTWELQIHVTDENLNGVSFIDRNNGFAVGDNGVILKTTNGGAGWSVQTTSPSFDWLKIFFASPQKGYLLGGNKIERTTNGGTTWEEVGILDRFINMWFLNENKGWAVGSSQGLYKTSDGVNWIDANTNLPHLPQCVSFATDSIGFVVITSTGGGEFVSYVYKTITGGTNWFSVDTLHNTMINNIFFIDSLNGWATGHNCVGGTACSLLGGCVYHTSDGGNTWTRDVLQPNSILYKSFFSDLNHGWAVGGQNPSVAPMIACRFVNLINGVNDIEGLPSQISLNQNYPNPFNPSTNISYEVPKIAHVTITINNILGQEVARLVDEIKQAGSYTLNWKADGLPSGVYYYRMVAGDRFLVKKMNFVK